MNKSMLPTDTLGNKHCGTMFKTGNLGCHSVFRDCRSHYMGRCKVGHSDCSVNAPRVTSMSTATSVRGAPSANQSL